MNKALKLLAMYIVLAVSFTIIGTALYFLFLNVINFSAGQKMILFNKDQIVKSFIYISACLIFIICPCLAYFRIRHRGGILQLLFYIALCVVTWALLFPLVLNVGAKKGIFENIGAYEQTATAGYFRKTGDNVYFFTKDIKSSESGVVTDAVIIDTTEAGGVRTSEVTSRPDFVLFEESKPYSDILIKDTFYNTSLSRFFNFRVLLNNAASAKSKGGTFWLGFLSLALVLCTVYGISHLFDWKLVDALFVLVIAGLVIFLNSYYYSEAMQAFRLKVSSNGMMNSLSSYFDAPLLVLMNLFLSIVFVVIGIIRFFKKSPDSDEA